MASARRPATALLILVAYLAGIIGGGLHHHGAESGSRAGTEALGQQAGQPGAWAVHGDHDADGCAVCAALHQAQAPPLAPAGLAHSEPAADVVAANPAEPPLSCPATTRARGPPQV